MNKLLLSMLVFVISMLTAAIGLGQVVDGVQADIPFAFHAGPAKFPAGKYVLQIDWHADLSVVEIRSLDGNYSALVAVRQAQNPGTRSTAELVFNHVGDNYFLSRIFDDRGKSESAVVDSGYSEKYGTGLTGGKQTHIPLQHMGS
jgi:hypothetical protein